MSDKIENKEVNIKIKYKWSLDKYRQYHQHHYDRNDHNNNNH